MKQLTGIAIGAGARGLRAYAPYATKFPDELKFVGVAEPHEGRRNAFKETFGVSEDMCFESWEQILAKGKVADVAFICTMDTMHYEPTMLALELGYDILLEKPISPNMQECMDIARSAEEKGRKVIVCHVLRYTPFFAKIKELIMNGAIGDLVTIQHNENIGWYHFSHSFVRGNWRNAAESSPMILQKCCHDMDIMYWLAGEKVTKLSSFGNLMFFNEKNKPEGAPTHCMDGCPVQDTCDYYAPKLYKEGGRARSFSPVVSLDNSEEPLMEALRKGQYGRCVFQCDNDVTDHQVVNLEFESGATAVFTACAFTNNFDRTIKILGTTGEIRANMGLNLIKLIDFKANSETVVEMDIEATKSGHGGGDMGIVKDFVEYVRSGKRTISLTDISEAVYSHKMSHACEKSRFDNVIVPID